MTTKASVVFPEVADITVRGRKSWAALGLFLAEMGKEIAYLEQMVYDGHTIRAQKDGWVIVVRTHNSKGHWVAFCGGRDPLGAYRSLYNQLYRGSLSWKVDKYVS